ncbi:MAG: Na(+)/H(+) antiporter subunit D [Gammaproteobacteria bacterium]|nr:MAG: Na(+)/H(+) antiporter subunit D [Gammaproteobacteria bacterium]
MMIANLPPFVPFFLAAALVPFLRGWIRQAIMVLVPIVGGLNLLNVDSGVLLEVSLLDFDLALFRVDKLSLLFGYLFHIAALIGIIYSLHVRDTSQHVTGLVYAGSALGAVFAGDLITLFIFWEILAVSSVFLVWANRSERAIAAGFRYMIIQVLAGVLLLSGILVQYYTTGSLVFTYLGLNSLASALIFLAFGIKGAFPLLHNWLIDAYPEATPTGTVFLSAFTTKVAVYALARAFPGTELLIYIGAAMTVFPIFYAVIENNLRRVLAYSMINQIGFMVTGIGLGTPLAINGAVAHAFNDVIFKGLLFMSMGAVLHMTGRIKASDLGGLYKTMPITTGLCIVGAASISAVPLFSGFVSKTMVLVAALDEGHIWVWLALLFASAGVLEHAGIKIPFFAFFAHDSGIRVKEPPRNMLIAMGVAAALSIFIGSYPWLLYGLLPYVVDYSPFDTSHVITQLQLLAFAVFGVFWMMRMGLYPPELRAVNLDSDWLYRKAAPWILSKLWTFGQPVDRAVRRSIVRRIKSFIAMLRQHHGPQGVLARSWPTGSMVLWVAILLGVYLVLYYL